MSASVIDLSVYQELKDNTGADFIVELIDTFLDDTPRQIQEMRRALPAGDTETFRRAAHSLKSNSATFGARHLSELARELEMLAKENQLGQVGERIAAVDDEYTRVAKDLTDLKT